MQVELIINIKKISILIIIRELDINQHNISEYISILIYLLNSKGTTLIFRKFYIINYLNAKTLININIIKLESIVLDL